MKIGLVTPGGFDRSGQERVIPVFLEFVKRLTAHHEVHVYTLYQSPQPDEFPLAGATIHNPGFRAGRGNTIRQSIRTLRLLVQEHQRGRFDLLHGLWVNESGYCAAFAADVFKIPSVVSVSGGELVSLPQIRYGGQRRWASRRLIAVTLRSATAVTYQSVANQALITPHRPDAVPCILGVDTKRFTPPTVLHAGPPWRLLHLASLNRVKDQPTLLRAFAQIHAEEPETHLDIIGEDTLNGAIQRLAVQRGLESAVTFHGFQPVEAVLPFLRRSHLLLHSSLSEGGPLVFWEAAACGVPVVGTAVGHIAEFAPHAATAVPVGDATALAEAALDLLRHPAKRLAMRKQALPLARQHNADAMTQRFEALYQYLLTRKRRQ